MSFCGSFVRQSAFNAACKHGPSVDILEFLLSRIVLTWREAILSATRGGHLHVLCWMSERQDSRGAWRRDFDHAFRCIAAHGHLKTAKWLHERDVEWNLSQKRDVVAEDMKLESTHNIRSVLFDAASNGRLEIIQWLHDVSPPTYQAMIEIGLEFDIATVMMLAVDYDQVEATWWLPESDRLLTVFVAK